MTNVPLGYVACNGRPFGLVMIASVYQEGRLIQFMSAWEKNLNTDKKLPTWVDGDPSVNAPKSEL
jgi:Asp-tRNA(Asn)/Glu-tRNA(Gln) amidotransferase A subunit family amidase